MILFLAIYLLGVVAVLILTYCSLEKGYRITIRDIMAALIYSASSWVGFIIEVVMFFSDYVVFTKK